jgi:hypothetical protein
MGDWLGTGTLSPRDRVFVKFEEARKFVRTLGLKSAKEWRLYSNGNMSGAKCRPRDIPANPVRTYLNQGWISWGDWLGQKT